MADSNDKAPVPELHLDELTGERVSKTELKKRQKQRQKDAEKALKLASRPAPGPKKTNAESEEKELNPNVLNPISNLKRRPLT
jgi:lysyl-tRNA synthetase class 2